jgi:alpha-L-fucosidase
MLIVDRMIGGKYEDYVTPERKIPEVPPTKVWESNIPLAKNWGFCPNDIYKPFEEILASLVQVVCLGGNLILGVGPKPDGRLPNEALAILRPLGEWLDTFGEGIYETRAIPELTIPGWTFTQKDNHIYAFQKRNEQNSLELKQIREELPVVTCLNTNERLTGEIITPIHDESYYQIYRLSY